LIAERPESQSTPGAVSSLWWRKCRAATGLLIAACLILGSPSKSAAADLSVTGMNQISAVRFSRTQFDYTYTINVTNSGPSHTNVIATVTSSAASTIVLQGQVALGNVASGASITSTATFKFRQDRTVLFDPSVLHWQFTYDDIPTLAPIAPQTVVVGSTLNLQLQGSDPAGAALTYGYSPQLQNATLNSSTGAFSFTPAAAQVGTLSVVFSVSNGQSSATQTVQITVVSGNLPPTANPQQLTLAEDTSAPLTLTGSDPQGNPLTFSIVAAPAHGTLSGTPPALLYTPTQDYFGPDAFQFIANDGVLNSAPATVAITVTAVNQPPVLSPYTATLRVPGTLPGVPPLPVCGGFGAACGIIYGDPHLITYDRALFDAQAVGELIATKSLTDDFEVQIRPQPIPNQRVVSMVVAVAMRVAGHRVAFYRTSTPTGFNTRIDGAFVELSAVPHPLPGGGTVGTYGTPDSAAVTWPDGSVVIVKAVGVFPQYYRFLVEVSPVPARFTHLIGMLGNADGNAANDLVTRDGQPIPYPNPPFATFYGTYINSWRISMAESLFDYDNGDTTATFTDLTFPDAPATPQSLAGPVLAAATSVCSLFGLTNAAVNAACVVDVGYTNDADFATEAAAAQAAGFGVANNAGSTAVGTLTTVAIGTPGATAVVTFSGTAGQQVTLSVSGNTIAAADLTMSDSSGNVVATLPVSSASAFHDTFTLPSTGTYTLSVVPRNQNTGSLSFDVGNVPVNSGSAAVGSPTAVTIDTVGQVGTRSFAGIAGQKYTLTVNSNTIPGADVTVRDPSGAVVTTQFVTGSNAFIGTFTLASTGTYTITVDPHDQTGTLTYTLKLVTDDVGATQLSLSTTVTLGTIGESGKRTFQGTAGENVALIVVSNTIPNANVTVLDPSGGVVATLSVSSTTAFLNTFTLPVTGTYTVRIDPQGQSVGTLTFVVFPVPINTGTTAFSLATTVTIPTAGEVAMRTFDAPAGLQATLSVFANSIAGVDLTISDPSGAVVTTLSTAAATATSSTFTFPVTGTYTISIAPHGPLTGSLSFVLNPIVNNNFGTTTIGTPTAVTIAALGQPALYTFNATAGQNLTLSVTGNTFPGVALVVVDPMGAAAATLQVTGATAASTPFTATAGSYVIGIVSTTPTGGTLTFTLTPN
jgi:Bacterial Ig domain/von Willebrand factor type D domain/Bacterial pre-peptidase C-terminal domain